MDNLNNWNYLVFPETTTKSERYLTTPVWELIKKAVFIILEIFHFRSMKAKLSTSVISKSSWIKDL